jgi:chromate transporter
VESTHGKLHFTAPLAAISAAVVGVIASLALFFIVHLALPAGATGPFDYKALLLAALAAVALLRYKVGIIPVIAACAAAGWLVSLI